ncbi:lysozyme inhibitor LprI family protein [Chitinophaga rhizophila]|uniref:Lysozyme inhibitor LprI family protein n=1 Tax=Chitinophaga rhizophila TaxID=2866212 RepID=A0ABS7GFP7_9BACT|nr:lysozyme inhibitor LprI family protein [Chitinophaga rhizophila]MBW8686070.1 lysozyme inhibitor LprI family protein [Chitinophaga rhizophila]
MNVFAQTNKVAIEAIERNYQDCLSEGSDHYNCAVQYYAQMDSLLNTVYHQLYENLDTIRRHSLELSQQQWKEKRENYFKEIDVRVEKKRPMTLAGLDDDMIVTDNKAAFLRRRVMELISKQS